MIFCLCKYSFLPLRLFFPLRRCPFLMRGLLRNSRTPEASSSSPSLPSEGRDEGGGCWDALVLLPEGLPLLPLDFCPARGVEVFLVARLLRTSAPLSLRLLRERLRGRLLVRSGRPCPRRFLGGLSLLITARSATW